MMNTMRQEHQQSRQIETISIFVSVSEIQRTITLQARDGWRHLETIRMMKPDLFRVNFIRTYHGRLR